VPGLFDEPPTFDRDAFRDSLSALAAENIFIGGSSWKYEGWLDQIYDRSLYLHRGKFSKRGFEESCLREYATVFPAVCGDFAFYQFPSEDFWRKLFGQVPPGFQFGFKVPEQITCKVLPTHARYGAQAGLENPTFLDARLFLDAFLRPLIPYHANTGVLIFEFGTFPKDCFADVDEFLDILDPFLAELPHVFNAWTRMPELPVQLSVPGVVTADFVVCRALLRRGRPYEEAVKKFQPYSEVTDPNPMTRKGLREIVQIAKREKRTAFVFVNNRLEGNPPGTIVSITHD
jgi:uncharacterized protein YecE (DUF72 family)